VGVFGGSISVAKFYVRGEVPKRFQAQYMKAIRLRAFEPLVAEEEDEERTGWCAPGNGLDLELEQQKIIFNEYVTLGLRIDKWRIPRTLFRAHFDEAVAEAKARTGKEKLSKKEKDDLKFRVNKRLRKKVLPSMRQFDLAWNVDRNEVLFWNRSPRVKDELCELFEKTFSLRLDEASPYMVARELLGEKAAQARFQDLEQSSFLDPSLVREVGQVQS